MKNDYIGLVINSLPYLIGAVVIGLLGIADIKLMLLMNIFIPLFVAINHEEAPSIPHLMCLIASVVGFLVA